MMKSVNWPKPGYTSIYNLFNNSNIPYNLINTTKLNDSSIVITIISCDYLNLSLADASGTSRAFPQVKNKLVFFSLGERREQVGWNWRKGWEFKPMLKCHCACSSEIGTCIINATGRQIAHKNNENTRFLVEARQTWFYAHVLKV